jgi:hypothetical protein|tara:strand:- start:29 stop:400 length:372 start_codon:yes stop_codon:yes gene_type:complete
MSASTQIFFIQIEQHEEVVGTHFDEDSEIREEAFQASERAVKRYCSFIHNDILFHEDGVPRTYDSAEDAQHSIDEMCGTVWSEEWGAPLFASIKPIELNDCEPSLRKALEAEIVLMKQQGFTF